MLSKYKVAYGNWRQSRAATGTVNLAVLPSRSPSDRRQSRAATGAVNLAVLPRATKRSRLSVEDRRSGAKFGSDQPLSFQSEQGSRPDRPSSSHPAGAGQGPSSSETVSDELFTAGTLALAVLITAISALVLGFVVGHYCARRCHKDDVNMPYADTDYTYFDQRQNVNTRLAHDPTLLGEEVTYSEPVLIPTNSMVGTLKKNQTDGTLPLQYSDKYEGSMLPLRGDVYGTHHRQLRWPPPPAGGRRYATQAGACGTAWPCQDPYCAWDLRRQRCSFVDPAAVTRAGVVQNVRDGASRQCPEGATKRSRLSVEDRRSGAKFGSDQPLSFQSEQGSRRPDRPSSSHPAGAGQGPSSSETVSDELFTAGTLALAVLITAISALVLGFVVGHYCARRCHKDDVNMPYADTDYTYFDQRQNVNTRCDEWVVFDRDWCGASPHGGIGGCCPTDINDRKSPFGEMRTSC
ncbi:uncharacterized protein LOC119095781 [Pollicipes pollicipes]|uniref:uncharacterized protein LOC119095781 n=1 Tax=Pollicipes pollicipes TaxID=41117 RepID=UPI0018849FF5|nr:uncharacterized protein LOC119095781 [Pollicipes pollicipes]